MIEFLNQYQSEISTYFGVLLMFMIIINLIGSILTILVKIKRDDGWEINYLPYFIWFAIGLLLIINGSINNT